MIYIHKKNSPAILIELKKEISKGKSFESKEGVIPRRSASKCDIMKK